jgi:hypothetical protein
MSTGRLGAGDTAIQPTILNAKGDLIAATAADTPAALTVGANGTVLTAASGEATGLQWAVPAAGGGMTLVETLTLSGASTTSGSIAGTYKHLFVVVKGTTASTNTDFYLRMNGDSGSNYFRNVITTVAPSTIAGSGVSSQAEIRLSDIGTATSAGQRTRQPCLTALALLPMKPNSYCPSTIYKVMNKPNERSHH